MLLSDTSIKRPVFAWVLALVLSLKLSIAIIVLLAGLLGLRSANDRHKGPRPD